MSRSTNSNADSNRLIPPITFVCLCLILFPASSAYADNLGLLRLRYQIEQRLASYDQQESQARATLQRAKSMRETALAQNDPKNADIAAQAAEFAQRTIELVTQKRRDDQTRLQTVQRGIDARESGTIPLFTRGKVLIQRKNAAAEWDGKSLQDGDTISLPTGSYLELLTEGGAVLTFGENSSFTYQTPEMLPTYRVIRGHTHVRHQQSKDSGHEEFRVPSGGTIPEDISIGAKGTEFVISADVPKKVTVFDGEVEARFPNGKIVAVKAGQELSLTGDPKKAAPVDVDLRSVPVWWQQ
jgi:hypothetical protein